MKLMKNCKNTKIQGCIGLGQAIAYFTKMGYVVSSPLNDSQDYDLVVEINEKLYKVQVKTTTIKTGSGYYQPYIKSCCKNTKKSYIRYADEFKYDYLFVTADNLESWFIPKTVINQKVAVTLNKEFDQYKV